MTTRPRAAILAIGDELILGEKLDTNTQWLANRLGELGLLVVEHRTAPDELDAIASSIEALAQSCQAVIVGGGLGPTADDLTRQGFAEALSRITGQSQPLVEDPEALEAIEAFFARVGRKMGEANKQQALRPRGAEGLPNDHGTAPGMLARETIDGRPCVIACLPGPPREMRPMFDSDVAPILQELPGVVRAELRVSQVFGLGESELASRIADLMERGNNPAVGTTASSGLVTCRVRVEPSSPVVGPYEASEPAAAAEEALERIARAAHGYVTGTRLESVACTLLRELHEQGLHIATAESCTGGMIGQMMTAEAGSSRAYCGGWVTYSNEMKVAELGVSEADLEAYGAVSEAVAKSMATGAADRAKADLGLAVTGIAGPDGGTPEKPVGTVWIGVAGPGEPASAKGFRFPGDRDSIRRWSANTALFIGLLAVRGQVGSKLLRQMS